MVGPWECRCLCTAQMPTLLQQAELPGSTELSTAAARGEPAAQHRCPARTQALPPAQPHCLAPPTGCTGRALCWELPFLTPGTVSCQSPVTPTPQPRTLLFFQYQCCEGVLSR